MNLIFIGSILFVIGLFFLIKHLINTRNYFEINDMHLEWDEEEKKITQAFEFLPENEQKRIFESFIKQTIKRQRKRIKQSLRLRRALKQEEKDWLNRNNVKINAYQKIIENESK